MRYFRNLKAQKILSERFDSAYTRNYANYLRGKYTILQNDIKNSIY